MADVQLRGDLRPTRSSATSSGKEAVSTSIIIGRCTVISTGSVIKPPARLSRGEIHYYPIKIGDNVFVGAYAVLFLWSFVVCLSGSQTHGRSAVLYGIEQV